MTPKRAVPAVCLDLIREFERGPDGSFAAKAYKDPVGVWTIGWGHALDPREPLVKAVITRESADEMAAEDLDDAAAELEAVLGQPLVDKLTEGQHGALVDFVFNEGVGHFQGSTLCRLLREDRMAAAEGEFQRWVYGGRPAKRLPGLVRRREAEAKVFKGQDWQ